MAAAAAGGTSAAGVGAIRGVAETEARAVAMAGAIGPEPAVQGSAAADAPRVEVPAGGGVVRRTHGRKE